MNLLESTQQARGQDFLALFNQTVVSDLNLKRVSKDLEGLKNQSLQGLEQGKKNLRFLI